MRCVVCGRLPSEECNERTHAVHDRLWKEYREKRAAQMLPAIEARRAAMAAK